MTEFSPSDTNREMIPCVVYNQQGSSNGQRKVVAGIVSSAPRKHLPILG